MSERQYSYNRLTQQTIFTQVAEPGTRVKFGDEYWIVVSCDQKNKTVCIARDTEMRTVTAEEIGLYWECVLIP